LKDSARQVWLAGIGALAKAKDQGGQLFDSLVEHGRQVEAHTVPMLNGLRQQAEDLLAGIRRKVSGGSKPAAGAKKRASSPRKPAARKKPAASTAKRATKTATRGKAKAKSSRKRGK
jgi:polyhydroxyalkanoate synthesis regulator phasin